MSKSVAVRAETYDTLLRKLMENDKDSQHPSAEPCKMTSLDIPTIILRFHHFDLTKLTSQDQDWMFTFRFSSEFEPLRFLRVSLCWKTLNIRHNHFHNRKKYIARKCFCTSTRKQGKIAFYGTLVQNVWAKRLLEICLLIYFSLFFFFQVHNWVSPKFKYLITSIKQLLHITTRMETQKWRWWKKRHLIWSFASKMLSARSRNWRFEMRQ